MNTVDKITKLFEKFGKVVQIQYRKKFLGLIPYTYRGWWMSFEDKDDHWFVFLTNGRDSHCRMFGASAIGADFSKKDNVLYSRLNMSGAWKSAISMWPVQDEQESIEIFEEIKFYIDKTYEHHFSQSS